MPHKRVRRPEGGSPPDAEAAEFAGRELPAKYIGPRRRSKPSFAAWCAERAGSYPLDAQAAACLSRFAASIPESDVESVAALDRALLQRLRGFYLDDLLMLGRMRRAARHLLLSWWEEDAP
jgi:hypothetical protein